MQQSSNPVLSAKLIKKIRADVDDADVMTVNGSLAKTGFMLAVLIAVGAFSWRYTQNNINQALTLVAVASISALVLAMIIIFGKKINAVTCTLYAAVQGVMLGAFSFLFSAAYQGIILQAISLTIALTMSVLFLYMTGAIKVTAKLRSIILISTVGVLLFYILTFVIGLFSPSFYDLVFSGSVGIFFAALIVFIASMNLLLDFDFIDKGAEQKLPKQFEWYASFGLMVTLIWLYISIIRLLAVSRN